MSKQEFLNLIGEFECAAGNCAVLINLYGECPDSEKELDSLREKLEQFAQSLPE